MTLILNTNSILHRSSRSIKRTALSISSSGVDSEKSATAHPTLFPATLPSTSPSLHTSSPLSTLDDCMSASHQDPLSISAGFQPLSKDLTLLKPRSPLNLAAFNVRTLMKTGQQAGLALTMDTLSIDVCCISESRIQDSSIISHLTAPNCSKKFYLRTSGDDEARAAGLRGVGIALSCKAEAALKDWIPISSRLCAVRLRGSIKFDKDRRTNDVCLLSQLMHQPTAALMSTKMHFTTVSLLSLGNPKART